MNEDAAIRRLRYGGLVRRKWASCGKAGLHLDCTWIRYSHRAKNGEPTVEDRSRAHHPLAAPVYCRVEEGPRATLRRLRIRLPRGVRVVASQVAPRQVIALAHRLAVPQETRAG